MHRGTWVPETILVGLTAVFIRCSFSSLAGDRTPGVAVELIVALVVETCTWRPAETTPGSWCRAASPRSLEQVELPSFFALACTWSAERHPPAGLLHAVAWGVVDS